MANEPDRDLGNSATADDEVEIIEIEDDLDTGMHRVNVCKVSPMP
jgi:hypothetical protein